MPTPPYLKAPFLPGSFYHIVSKSIDGILLFRTPPDFAVFKERFCKFNDIIFEIWSYCLLNNHSHFIVKTRSADECSALIHEQDEEAITLAMNDPGNELLFGSVAERQMNSFLASYANYYNNRYDRQGGIFQKPFKRLLVVDENHLQQAIIYVHANPQKHGLTDDFSQYSYSSYNEILSGGETIVAAEKVTGFFGSPALFRDLHLQQAKYFYSRGSKLE